MGARVHSSLQVFPSPQSSFSAIVTAEYASSEIVTSSNQIILPRQSSGFRSSSIYLTTQLKQVVRARLKKIQCRNPSSATSFSPSSGELWGDGIAQSRDAFEFILSSASHAQRRRVGVLCSLNNSSVPSPPSSASHSKDSGSAHSSSLSPPCAVSVGPHSTFTNGAPNFVESVTTTGGSFFESVTRPEDLDLTEGGELPVQILEGLDDQNGNFLDLELQGLQARPEDLDLTGGGELPVQILEGLDDQNGNFLDLELQGLQARPEDLDLTGGGELPVQILEGLDDQNGNLLDPELQGILANIADMQRQNEMLTEQMRNFQQLLTKTTRSLNVKAQEAKIEAAKLKKLAKLHQIEEIRRGDDVRRKVLEARIQEELRERTSLEDAYQRRRQDVTDDEPFDLGEHTVELTSRPDEVLEKEEEVVSEESVADTESQTSSEEVSELLECVIAHPGALSCTKTVIKSDPSKKSAVVMMETSVSCAGDACLLTSLDEDDYVALAVQSLAETAHEMKTTRFQRATLADPVKHRKHNAISETLATGRIVKAHPMDPPSKFGHESLVVRLLNKQTGRKIDAMCKPGIEGHADGWHRAAIELVAYELNLMLGMDYVPPVAYRSGGVDVNYKHFKDGAFVYYVPNAVPLRKVAATKWGVSVAMMLSDTRILDVLLNNSDRHHGHFLFGEHWADGKMRPVLIDHAAGFRREAVVKMDHENAFQTGPVRCVSSKTYVRLRFLEKQTIESKFKGILSPNEVNKMMDRRDMILSYLDNLVAERGYHKTVIET